MDQVLVRIVQVVLVFPSQLLEIVGVLESERAAVIVHRLLHEAIDMDLGDGTEIDVGRDAL